MGFICLSGFESGVDVIVTNWSWVYNKEGGILRAAVILPKVTFIYAQKTHKLLKADASDYTHQWIYVYRNWRQVQNGSQHVLHSNVDRIWMPVVIRNTWAEKNEQSRKWTNRQIAKPLRQYVLGRGSYTKNRETGSYYCATKIIFLKEKLSGAPARSAGPCVIKIRWFTPRYLRLHPRSHKASKMKLWVGEQRWDHPFSWEVRILSLLAGRSYSSQKGFL